MIQLRQTADFSNDECEHVGIISRGGKGDAFDGVGTVFEFVYGVVDRSEGSCGEEGDLMEIALILRPTLICFNIVP